MLAGGSGTRLYPVT
ncbi:MAG: hypothetical protein GU354_00135 [Caldimicrobium sp.]|nr:hypothetical protein [Caldimicrobium sp.]